MARADGLDLVRLRSMAQPGGDVPPRAALHLIAEVARARGSIRERAASIAPGSVLITGEGDVHLREVGADQGIVFVAPEARGKDAAGFEPRAEVYALGALLSWLLAPLDDGAGERRGRRELGALTIAGPVDDDVLAIITRATQRSPEARYESAAAVAAECERALEHRGSHAAEAAFQLVSWLRSLDVDPSTHREQGALEDDGPEDEPTLSDPADGPRARIGKVIDGRYRIVEKIGSGGMGTVYRAVQLAIDRDVALKTLRLAPDRTGKQRRTSIARFEVEAKVIAQLRHPNTLRLFDFGRVGEDELYLVSELLIGETLDAQVDRGPLPEERVLRVIAEVADALAEAHDKEIIHRDIKPRNIFLERHGDREIAKVLDFGVAKLRGSPVKTRVGTLVGSPAYVSPEQATGEEVSPVSDLYSLGVTAYECLAGVLPFEGSNSVEVLEKHVNEQPVRLSERTPPVAVDRELEDLVMSMLEKRPEDRPQSAAELRRRLLEIERRAYGDARARGASPRPRGDDLIGATLHNYQIEDLLGAGPFARVYRASHAVIGRRYAIKVLTDAGAGSESASKRLRREAEALGKLSHPNIVEVIDFGSTPDGRPYLVTEFLAGRTLERLIAEAGRFAPARAGAIAHQIASALAAAHAAGWVHRKLDPRKVMVVDRGGTEHVKVLDFGLSRMLEGAGGRTALTSGTGVLGSPQTIAPEQIAGASNAGPAADLYALGCLLYAMLAGRLPFVGSPVEVIDQHRRARPLPLEPAGGLEALALRLLEKDPAARPRDAQEVIGAIERLDLPDRPPPAPESIRATPSGVTPIDPASVPRAPAAPAAHAPVRLGWIAAGVSVILLSGAITVAIAVMGRPRAGGRGADDRAPPPTARVSARAEPGPAASPPPGAAPPPASPPEPAPPAAAGRAPPRPKPTNPRAAWPDLESRVARALSSRGLALADLDAVPEFAPALRAWRAAAQRKDGVQGAPAAAQLLEGLKALPLDARLVRAKLDRLSRQLARLTSSMSRDELDRLEKRYFELGSALGRDTGEAALADLVARIDAFEREVSSLARGSE